MKDRATIDGSDVYHEIRFHSVGAVIKCGQASIHDAEMLTQEEAEADDDLRPCKRCFS